MTGPIRPGIFLPRHRLTRRFLAAIFSGVFLLALGTVGYVLIEGWSWLDSLWMTVVTLSTVGYSEVIPLTVKGRFFTMGLLIVGIIILGFTVGTLSQLLFEGEFRDLLGQRRMMRELKSLKGHYVVCGYGRSGRAVAMDLAASQVPVVAIEKDAGVVTAAIEDGRIAVIHGDATSDDVLETVGVRRARGLVTCLPEDFLNVFVVLSSRVMSPDLLIVAQARDTTSETKLQRAGANHIINPANIGGRRMAAAILKPGVLEFLDVVMSWSDEEWTLEELTVREGSPVAGKELMKSEIRVKSGAIILALRRKGRYLTNPDPREVLVPEDRLIALGTPGQISRLKDLV